jgi:hypothetical protein
MFLATPSLNQAALLQQCIHNVESLGHSVHHHVADAVSKDGTWMLLAGTQARRGFERFSYTSQPDEGLYDALNTAFATTEDGILGWLNCDDLLLPWTATCVEATFRAHPEVDVVVGDALELREGRWALTVLPPPSLLLPYFRSGSALAQPAVFFRRRLFERLGGFDLRYKLMADTDFFVRALESGARFHKLWELLAVQRMVPGQLMEKHADRAFEEWGRLRWEHGLMERTRALPGALHRAGILSLLAPLTTTWPRARAAHLLEASSLAEVASALFRSSRGRTYLKPGPGMGLLLPMASEEAVLP